MSNRHRSHKETAPGATHPAPPKEERRAANRKARHRTHELLAHTDLELGEEIVAPRPVHTRLDIERGIRDPDFHAATLDRRSRAPQRVRTRFTKIRICG